MPPQGCQILPPLSAQAWNGGGGSYSLADAGLLPFPLTKFEALQHAHMRRVVGFATAQLASALATCTASELEPLFNGGEQYPVSDADDVSLQRMPCCHLPLSPHVPCWHARDADGYQCMSGWLFTARAPT